MLWILIAATAFAGIVALRVLVLFKRAADGNGLGSVSSHWVAEHRVDSVDASPR